MMYIEIAKVVLLLNLLIQFFLVLVYIRKIKKRKSKKKFLFGLLFMVIIFMIQSVLGLVYVTEQVNVEFLVLMALQTIGFAGLLFAEFSDLKRYR